MRLAFRRQKFTIERDDARFFFEQLSNKESRDLATQYEGDELGAGIALFVRACVGWENVEDDEGNPVECTEDNKLALIEWSPVFMIEVINEFNSLLIEGAEAERKNSLSGRRGTSRPTDSRVKSAGKRKRDNRSAASA